MTSRCIRYEDALSARLEAGIAMVREAGQLARQAFATMTPEQIEIRELKKKLQRIEMKS